MKKAKLIAGVTAAIPVAVAGFAAPAAAHITETTIAPAHQVPAKGKTVQLHGIHPETFGPQWASISVAEWLYPRSGGSTLMGASDRFYNTCYYSGNTGYTSDKYWDHVTQELIAFTNHHLYITGHIADAHMDFGGLKAPKVLPHC